MKIKNIAAGLLLFSLLFIYFCSKKADDSVIASVGKTKITTTEFHQRYEFTPQTLQTGNKEQNKRNFFLSLLGEKVFSEKAYELDLHRSEKFQTYSEQMENEAIVEKLFQQEVTEKIEVPEQELKQAYFKSRQTLQLQVLNFDSLKDALRADELIQAGMSLSDVKRTLQTQVFISTDSVLTLSLKWGEAHPKIEDIAYALALNEVSAPIEVQGVSFILKLINKSNAVFMTEADYYQEAGRLKKLIRSRKSEGMFDDFLQSLMKDKKLHIAHETFAFVARELEKVYGIDDDSLQDNNEVETADSRGSLYDHLNDTFARFEDGNIWTIGDFIKKLSVGPYPLDSRSNNGFRSSLRRAIRRMAEFESLAASGRASGIQNSAYVVNQTRMWRDSYAASIMKTSILDTVRISEESARYYYKRNQQKYIRPEMLKLRQIKVADKNLATSLYHRILAGENFSKLARKYSENKMAASKELVEGFITTQAWGKIGTAASELKPGETTGPVKTEENLYAVIQLIEKLPEGIIPYEELVDDIKSDVLAESRERVLDGYLNQYADDIKIKINKTAYDSLKTYDINMLVVKKHFPNRLAAPLLDPTHKHHRWRNRMEKIFP